MWFYLLQDSHSNTLCFQNLQSDLTGTWFKSALSRSAITSPKANIAVAVACPSASLASASIGPHKSHDSYVVPRKSSISCSASPSPCPSSSLWPSLSLGQSHTPTHTVDAHLASLTPDGASPGPLIPTGWLILGFHVECKNPGFVSCFEHHFHHSPTIIQRSNARCWWLKPHLFIHIYIYIHLIQKEEKNINHPHTDRNGP